MRGRRRALVGMVIILAAAAVGWLVWIADDIGESYEEPTPSIADFACCGYLYYPEPFGFDRAEWPHINRWLDGIAALPGWKHPYDLMPGNPSDRATKEDA